VDKWLTSKEDEMNKIKSDTNITDNDIIMQQVHSIQVINSNITFSNSQRMKIRLISLYVQIVSFFV